MGVVFGVCAAVLWGLGDYLITILARRTSTPAALVLIQCLSLVSWLFILVLQPEPPPTDIRLWGLLILTGICHVAGLVFVYRAFEIGTLSLVSPISSAFAVVTAALALTSGEQPPWPALSGTALLIGGIGIATRGSAPGHPGSGSVRYRGIPEAIASALGFGTMFWLFYFFIEPEMAHIWPLIVLKLMATAAAIVLFWRGDRGNQPSFKTPSTLLLAVGAALADTSAWLAYLRGSQSEFAAVVTALASLFSVVTILLAGLLLRERLKPSQWAGVAVILFGILLVSI